MLNIDNKYINRKLLRYMYAEMIANLSGDGKH